MNCLTFRQLFGEEIARPDFSTARKSIHGSNLEPF
jgi:hypothetical protein